MATRRYYRKGYGGGYGPRGSTYRRQGYRQQDVAEAAYQRGLRIGRAVRGRYRRNY